MICFTRMFYHSLGYFKHRFEIYDFSLYFWMKMNKSKKMIGLMLLVINLTLISQIGTISAGWHTDNRSGDLAAEGGSDQADYYPDSIKVYVDVANIQGGFIPTTVGVFIRKWGVTTYFDEDLLADQSSGTYYPSGGRTGADFHNPQTVGIYFEGRVYYYTS